MYSKGGVVSSLLHAFRAENSTGVAGPVLGAYGSAQARDCVTHILNCCITYHALYTYIQTRGIVL